jgi:ligand-binding SRPBCC domain-containing protein
MTTYHLHRRQFIPRPLEDVFAFFADAGNLARITPPALNFQFVTPLPIKIETGTLIDYRLRLLGVPFRWRTLIDPFNPPHCFADHQARGPYKRWRHLHEFFEQDGGTLMVDRVEYELYLGPIGWLVNRWFVRPQLEMIFDFRYRTIEQLLPECRTLEGAAAPAASQSVT